MGERESNTYKLSYNIIHNIFSIISIIGQSRVIPCLVRRQHDYVSYASKFYLFFFNRLFFSLYYFFFLLCLLRYQRGRSVLERN